MSKTAIEYQIFRQPWDELGGCADDPRHGQSDWPQRSVDTDLLLGVPTSGSYVDREPLRAKTARQAAEAARSVWHDTDFGWALGSHILHDHSHEFTTKLDSGFYLTPSGVVAGNSEVELSQLEDSWTCLLRRMVQNLGFGYAPDLSSSATQDARAVVNDLAGVTKDQRVFAERVFFEIDRVVGRGKSEGVLQRSRVICADNEDTGSLLVEWVFPECRLSYWIDRDPAESSWCLVSMPRIDQRGDGALRPDSVELGLILLEEINDRF